MDKLIENTVREKLKTAGAVVGNTITHKPTGIEVKIEKDDELVISDGGFHGLHAYIHGYGIVIWSFEKGIQFIIKK